jgi:hypothetical protein
MSIGFIDPPYLRHLGELASLKIAIACHFHQDSGLDYPDDEDRWAAILNESGPAERSLLAAQLRELLFRDDAYVVQFLGRVLRLLLL